MANIWPIENVWSIMKAKVLEEEPKTKPQLKKVITKIWRQVNADKELGWSLVSSIPDRLHAVVDVDGDQIRMSDYRGNNEE